MTPDEVILGRAGPRLDVISLDDLLEGALKHLEHLRRRLLHLYDAAGARQAGQWGLFATATRSLLREGIEQWLGATHLQHHFEEIRAAREPNRTVFRHRCIEETLVPGSASSRRAWELETRVPALDAQACLTYHDEVWTFLEEVCSVPRSSSIAEALEQVDTVWAQVRALLARPETSSFRETHGISLEADISRQSVITPDGLASLFHAAASEPN